ncbi:FG-GAP-like repeat-containing protein [Mesorhizobium sp.]|uniref:FG-GAP-like repeat-containing protein n=1 Tax=Mesorhizobium sp. TaxID=1871066 RepID=UPI00257C8031|nr:FG-GAP-like repeat-containing protein [Mesorhizobium sp.]
MIGTRLWICRAANSSRGCRPTTRCSRATRSIFDVCCRLVVTLAVAVSIASCDSALGRNSEEALRTGLAFDRREVADHSGDVKLVGDIDGDGRLDLVLGGLPQSPLSWWRWPDLLLTTIATARVEFTTDGVLVDTDGDGDLDIVTADGPDGANLVWFENPRPDRDPTDGPSWKTPCDRSARRLGQRHQGGRFRWRRPCRRRRSDIQRTDDLLS